jgi:hypothetical protein
MIKLLETLLLLLPAMPLGFIHSVLSSRFGLSVYEYQNTLLAPEFLMPVQAN